MWCKILWNVVSLTRLRAGCILVLRSDIQWFYRDVTQQTVKFLRLKCVLIISSFRMMVNALESDYFWQFCHKNRSKSFSGEWRLVGWNLIYGSLKKKWRWQNGKYQEAWESVTVCGKNWIFPETFLFLRLHSGKKKTLKSYNNYSTWLSFF